MPLTKKQKSKKKKQKKNIEKNLMTVPSVLTEDKKEFYLDQINSLEPRLIRYQKRCDELELMCRSYGDQFEILLKDKRDISSYLKKQLELRNEQVFDLNDRLIGLQQVKTNEKDLLEKKYQDCKEKSRLEIEKLENENMLLKTRLISVEEFKSQRQTMETTIDDLKNLILKKEDAYKKALEQMEIALICFKDRLKKEAIEYLNELAIEFRQHSKNQISNTIKRAIHENFYLNNQIDYLSNQLEKSIEINKKSRDDNQHLTRTVAILEDVENESAKKYFATENIIRMLCKKLKECQEQKKNSIHEIVEKNRIDLIRTVYRTKTIVNEDDHIKQEDELSIEIKNLKEENDILKEIIDRAAISIANVIQGKNEHQADSLTGEKSSQCDDSQTLEIEKRNEMLEQLLSILLTSHHLGRSGLTLQKKSPFLKGIFPGTRLGLHRIHPDSSSKPNTHYSLGDLGLIPSDKTV